jgi:hypothetical protein
VCQQQHLPASCGQHLLLLLLLLSHQQRTSGLRQLLPLRLHSLPPLQLLVLLLLLAAAVLPRQLLMWCSLAGVC